MISRFFRQILTGRDNSTHDMGRWSWLLCVGAVLVHDGFQVYKGLDVNPKDLAFALAAVVAAHGAALGFKASTEPTP